MSQLEGETKGYIVPLIIGIIGAVLLGLNSANSTLSDVENPLLFIVALGLIFIAFIIAVVIAQPN